VRFQSILFPDSTAADGAATGTRCDYAGDLNIDQIVDAVTRDKEEYDLKPFFYAPVSSVDAIEYRQQVMRDIRVGAVRSCIDSFAEAMRTMRRELAQAEKLHYPLQKERWLLHACQTYCSAVSRLRSALCELELTSRGLSAFRDFLTEYTRSEGFASLESETRAASQALADIQYSVLIKGNGFSVRRYGGEPDYSEEVARTFQRFRQGAVKDYLVKFRATAEMNHVEAKILDFVALLFPDAFSRLHEFAARHHDFIDATVRRFDREIQFYISYVDFIERLEQKGLAFCLPSVSASDKSVFAGDTFDLALAAKLFETNTAIMVNDFELRGRERIFIVSGPNQGGKTTFARTFGQLHHLAAIGCPVPGSRAKLFLFDAIFTHFEREETIESLHGKLEDDLVRIHDILERATPRGIVIINEIFSSTSLRDAVFLAKHVIEKIASLDLLSVCVTFLDELASFSEKTVSMVSTVLPENPAVRTFKVIRRPAEGRSYAVTIAERYGLTYERLRARLFAEHGG
jgi:DNA mismatch repair protein MutS